MAKAATKKTKPDLIDSAAKLPKGTKIAAFAGVTILLGLLFYVLFYMPYSEEVTDKESNIAQTRADIQKQQTSLKNHGSVADFSVPIEDAYAYMQRYLPSENEMPRLVQMVSEIGAQAGLTDGVTLFAPKLPATVRENYAEIPFTLNLEGEFLTVLKFLYDFSRMDRIVNITDVSLGTPKMIDEKREILFITVKCSGSTYRSLTEAEIAQQGKKK